MTIIIFESRQFSTPEYFKNQLYKSEKMSQPLLHVKSSNFARLYEEDRDLRGKLLEEYRTLCVVMVYQVVTWLDLLSVQLLKLYSGHCRIGNALGDFNISFQSDSNTVS